MPICTSKLNQAYLPAFPIDFYRYQEKGECTQVGGGQSQTNQQVEELGGQLDIVHMRGNNCFFLSCAFNSTIP